MDFKRGNILEEKDLAIRFIDDSEGDLEEIINTYSEKLLRYAKNILCDYYEA